MPRYFFNSFTEVETPDEEGVELADDAAATALALKSAREMAADEVKRGGLQLHHRVEAVNQKGRSVASFSFGAAAGIA